MYTHEARYDDLRKAVEKLYSKLVEPYRKQGVGYVLALFAMQDESPGALRESISQGRALMSEAERKRVRSEAMKKAWARRKEREKKESTHES